MKKNKDASQRIPRRLICIPVLYATEGTKDFVVDYSTDLSEGGVLIQTTTPMPMDTTLDLKFRLPGAIKLIEVKGKVMWAQQYIPGTPDLNLVPGMGVKFVNLDDRSKKYIEAFIKKERGTRVFEDDIINDILEKDNNLPEGKED
ncbi:MAG TPA: TIGR02266 family protein [bacterium]